MDISVVIPTRNRCQVLDTALESILAQRLDGGAYEVLVVDNGSTDDTFGVVERHRARHPQLRYCSAPEPGLHVGRHAGLRESSGDILVFVDDDIRAWDGWLAALRQAFADPQVAIAGGKVLPEWAEQPPDWIMAMWQEPRPEGRMLEHLSIIDLGDEPRTVNPYFVFGCNFAVRRAVLIAAGGFHPDGFPQELIRFRGDGESWVSKYVGDHGLKAAYHPGASVFHRVPAARLNEAYFCQRQYHQGISDSYTRVRARGRTDEAVRPLTTARRRLRRVLRRLLGRDKNRAQSGPLDLIRERMKQSYDAGYAFHQQAVREDPQLLAWVLRESYL